MNRIGRLATVVAALAALCACAPYESGGAQGQNPSSVSEISSRSEASGVLTGETEAFRPLTVSNGSDEIQPYPVFVWAEINEAGSALCADGEGMFGYDMWEHIEEYPAISCTGGLTVSLPTWTEIIQVSVWRSEGEKLGVYNAVAELPTPESGRFCVKIETLFEKTGENGGARSCSEYYFLVTP